MRTFMREKVQKDQNVVCRKIAEKRDQLNAARDSTSTTMKKAKHWKVLKALNKWRSSHKEGEHTFDEKQATKFLIWRQEYVHC